MLDFLGVLKSTKKMHNVPWCRSLKSFSTRAKTLCDYQKPKQFTQIPGPHPLPLLGNIWRYAIGEYTFDRLHLTGLKKYNQFGPIVREEILPNVNLLLLFRPEDIEMMYQREGRYPSRRSHQALEFYRLQRPEVYNGGGLLPTLTLTLTRRKAFFEIVFVLAHFVSDNDSRNGPEWHRLRQSLQRPINVIDNVRRYIPDIDSIACEFALSIDKDVSAELCSLDFLQDLSKAFLEFLGIILFDTRLGSLQKTLQPESLPAQLIQAASDTNNQILRTDNGLQLWRKYPTKSYKILSKAQQITEQVALKFVNQKLNFLKNKINTDGSYTGENKPKTLLEVYLTSKDLDTKDVVTMVSDMLLAGIDTVGNFFLSAYATSFIMYNLAINQDKQTIVAEEIRRNLPKFSTPISLDILANLHYLKAAIKESFRLNPISIGVGRILPEESIIAGYLCPKNTILVSQNQVSCRLETYFSNPGAYEPGRWIKGHPAYNKVHPYLVLPFGHGPRACIARRLAEQNIQLLLIRVLQKYRIHWEGNKLDSKSLLINRPDSPLKFRFAPRFE